MPIARQMEVVSSASVLIGVHGQAVAAFAFFLPAELRRTAIVEIIPRRDALSNYWTPIIRGVARGAGVRHYRMEAARSPGCYLDYLRQLNCSVARDTRACSRDRGKALRNYQAVNVLNCNVTVEARVLLRLVGEADNHTHPDHARSPCISSSGSVCPPDPAPSREGHPRLES